MKKVISTGLAFLLLFAMTTGAFASSETGLASYDFEDGDNGFIPIFADLPADDGTEAFYELKHEHTDIPIPGAGKGLLISGNNHSDDLFIGWYKQIDNLTPGQRYRFIVSFKLATNVEGGMIGVGGSPGASVIVKCGVVDREPKAVTDELNYYRLNIDKGQQMQEGAETVNAGNIEKMTNEHPGEYEFNEYAASFDVTADEAGAVWLLIGTDSGFEATSTWYLDDVSIEWMIQRELTRAEAVQLLYEAEGNGADIGVGSFSDVATSSPYAKAIGWAQNAGYVNGYGGGIFGAEDAMTVEQATVVLYRFAGEPDADPAVLEWYDGGAEVSEWARNAIAWAVMWGYLNAEDIVTPQATVLQGDFYATILLLAKNN